MKSRFGAALEPFTIVRLDFYEKENRDLVTLSRAEIVKSNFDLAAQLEVAEVLGYMAELIGEFAPPHEANDKLYPHGKSLRRGAGRRAGRRQSSPSVF